MLNAESTKLILKIKDSESASTQDELVVKFMGGNPERKSCADLKKDLEARKLEAEIDGVMMPILLEDNSGCNLESARAVAIASLPDTASEIYGTKGKAENGSLRFVLNFDSEGFRYINIVNVKTSSCEVEKKSSTILDALVVAEDVTATETDEAPESDDDSIQ